MENNQEQNLADRGEKQIDGKKEAQKQSKQGPSNKPGRLSKHVVLDAENMSTHTYVRSERMRDSVQSGSHLDFSYGRRRSIDRNSEISITLMSHALREIISEQLLAGPRGALLTVQSPTSSFVDGHKSQHALERMYLRRRTTEGGDIPADLEDAIAETGHGRFQCMLLALCGFIYSCCSLSTTTLSFVLPAASYDLKMTSSDKGILNTAPLWGMVLGAYVWGSLADAHGRRYVLIYSLLMDACAAFCSSFCQSYLSFFIFRIFNGFAIIGCTSMVFAYLGEFLDCSMRDRYLSRLELFWTFGIVALPVIGFFILPHRIMIGSHDGFHYNSWRIFVLACGVPSLIAGILMTCMPETPRFLLLQGEDEETRKVLVRMFVMNTKMKPEHFPVKVLNMHEYQQDYYFTKVVGMGKYSKFKSWIYGSYQQHRNLLRGQSLCNILITCFIDFGLMSVYYSIMLWVPELIHREELFELAHKDEKVYLCETQAFSNNDTASDEPVDTSTFVHTFIICLACLPTNIMLLFLIQWVSKKALLAGIMVSASIPTAALSFMKSTFEVTTMLCIFEALTTLVEAVLFCCIVELFPLHTRGTALSLTVTVGRLGAVLGNIFFGLMIDTKCNILFFLMSVMLILSGLSAFLLPRMRTGH